MKRLALSTLLLSTSLWIACGADDVAGDPLGQAVTAIGGKEALLGLRTLSTSATGQRFEPGQARSPGGTPLALGSFSYSSDLDLTGDRVALAWQRSSLIGSPLKFSEIVNQDRGYFDGIDSVTGMAPQSAMQSSRVAAVRKHQRLFLPHLLLRRALQSPSSVTVLPQADYLGKPHHVLSLTDNFQPVRVFIDAASGQIDKVDTIEDDPMRGDVLIEVATSAWTQSGTLRFPTQMRLSLAGVPIHDETRTVVAVNPNLADSKFTVPAALSVAPDSADAARGEAISEYLHRFAAIGFPADQDAAKSLMVSELAKGVLHLTGAVAHSLAIETQTGIVVAEAPTDDARSRAVIAEIRKRIPGKPITHIINTHHHDDHAGGLRTYVAEGATVVTAKSNEAYLTQVFQAPHKARPDQLQQTPAAQRKLVTVGSSPLELKDAAHTIRVYNIAANHAEGMLVVYIEDLTLLFVADLFSPGFFPADRPIQGEFQTGAQDLYKAITVLGLSSSLSLVGAHGFGTAPLSVLKVNAGL